MTLFDWIAKTAQAQTTRSRILNDPYYRFQSVAELQLAARLGVQIDVNQAGVDDWLRLPGLSIHQARTLTELTQSGVPLHALEDIAAVLNLPLQRLQPLAPVLRFCYYDPTSPLAIQPIDVNTASLESLTRIPGVDLYLARLMVHYRPYRNLPHLQRRLTLSSELTAQLLHYLKF
ncbi:MAG: ComEA family DNA-binding protein [Leptolyngbyaceae cyanobacterium bins.349]|nr:ComEA family DNA-binding protein [Leptolyngbyaceae cyanobacterium bins.349]